MRKIFSTVSGLFIAFALLSAFDALNSAVYPLPDLMTADSAALVTIVADLPIPGKTIVTASWLIAPFCGAWIALRIGDWKPGGWVVMGLFLAANIANQIALPHPVWMQICSVLLPVAGGWLAQRLHRRPYPGEPLLG